MAVTLHELGYFTWKEWVAALTDELQAADDCGTPDDSSNYYHHWLTALEHLVTNKKLVTTAALADRKEAWEEAYRRTPHGKPVELDTAGVYTQTAQIRQVRHVVGLSGIVPSSQRRGGRDLKIISPKASIVRSGRGGQSISDHPVCAFRGSFAIFS